MRDHPIPPVTEPQQYRAIGVVRGVYVPADPEQLTRGAIHTADGQELEAVVLGRLLTLMRRHLDLAQPHLWVVYPRSREEGGLHLQMVGIWEPSTLAAAEPPADPAEPSAASAQGEAAEPTSAEITLPEPTSPEPSGGDALPEGDDYFSVRGELVFTKPESGDLVVKVRQLPRADQRPAPFKLQLRGEVPLAHLRHFVSLDLRRQGQTLSVEAVEVLAPVDKRGSRGGKDRPSKDRSSKDRPSKDRSGKERGPRRDTPRDGHQGGDRPQPQAARSAVVRPGR
ncbi:hypothetical protein KBY96_09465 [Cyanobium sp. ATX 6A2]|uniref:hypothetical protein n=1 Tax=Cyanobium sp. ATX 6A2 TaxID=2823700 RepID=UPI0020CD4003|nr:hypothetical protein [Cyanobium sp. ATX 6A2]MCP9888152.1 hypothetical protein [Cyanobium sp. ATX 6A2]